MAGEIDDADGLEPTLVEKPGEFGGGHEPEPREQGHDVDGEGAEEREAPAPVGEILRGQVDGEEREQRARHHEAERRAELRDHRVPATALPRRVEGEQRGHAVPGAAEREALRDPQHREQLDGDDADRVVARQEADRRGRAAEQEQGEGELHPASVPLVDPHEEDRPERAGDEGQREDGERVERAREGGGEGEEHLREHQHRGDAEHEEVEIFRRPPDHHAERDVVGADVVVAHGHLRVALERVGIGRGVVGGHRGQPARLKVIGAAALARRSGRA
ncbi:hypothetical protein M2440_002269 [Methylorubrum extorquens]|nr:hypothetical protein [Methylorubrum extorquens]